MMKNHKGIFITFEGGEGAGKSSVLERIYKELQREGLPVVKTREPGGSLLGEKIRNLLLCKNDNFSIGTRAELLLFLAARAQHVDEVILPALEGGNIVLCDRFQDSTLAYQGIGRGLSAGHDKSQHGQLKTLEELCLFASDDLIPNSTLLFDIDPRIGLQRASKAAKAESASGSFDRIEDESMQFHQAIREAFLAIAKKDPERITIINAEHNFQTVSRQAISVVRRALTV